MKYCYCASCNADRCRRFFAVIDNPKNGHWEIPIRTAAQTAAQVRADNEANDDGA
jgi:hypothetical protein